MVRGPSRGASLRSTLEALSIGSAETNDLVLQDPTVSREHLRLEQTGRGLLVTDLGSTNGTWHRGLELRQALVHARTDLRLGDSTLRLTPLGDAAAAPDVVRFGRALGRSAAMRHLFAQLSQVAGSDATVLLEGETGTGKELLAEALHQHGPRAPGPFVVVDCGAIPAGLSESELFGHLRGAFTGAVADRRGAFEEADGGTLFLDEVAELELPVQLRLLRALERRQVKRVGEERYRTVDVRVVAATNRELELLVQGGGFRADLFYRLAVVHLRVPPLRQRPADVRLLVEELLPAIAARHGVAPPALDEESLRLLCAHAWPGNARELRNYLERLVALSLDPASALPEARPGLTPPPAVELADLAALPFREAKLRWTAAFDTAYVQHVLARNRGNVAEAARESGIDRVHLFRLIKKYGLRG